MFKPVRIVATIIFLGSIGLVLVGAFVLRNSVRISVSFDYYCFDSLFVLRRQILCLGMPPHLLKFCTARTD